MFRKYKSQWISCGLIFLIALVLYAPFITQASQTYTDDTYASGHQAATDLQAIEDNFAALKSTFYGASAPSNPIAGMWWSDSTNHLVKMRNEANSAWLSVWDLANNKPVIANLSAEITTAMITAGNITHSLLAADAVETDNIKDGSVTFAKCSFGGGSIVPVAGTSVGIASGPTERTTTSTSYTKKKEAEIIFAGTYTVSYAIKLADSYSEAHAKVYVDDSPYGSEHTEDNGVYTTFTDTVTVTAGQKISVYIKTDSGSRTAYIKNFLVTCGNNPFMTSAVTD